MKDPPCGLRLSAPGLAGRAAHPPLRGRPQTRRRVRAVRNQSKIIAKSSPRSGRTQRGTLAGATPAGRPAPGPVGQRASGQERDKSASGSAQRGRTLRSAKRGTECVPRKSRSLAAFRQDRPSSLRQRSSPAGRAATGGTVERARAVGVAE